MHDNGCRLGPLRVSEFDVVVPECGLDVLIPECAEYSEGVLASFRLRPECRVHAKDREATEYDVRCRLS